MGIFDLLRHKDEPEKEIDAGALGKLTWSDDDKSWRGQFGGIEFFVFGDGSDTSPSRDVLAYAESILMDLDWLNGAVEGEKKKYASKYPKFESELQALEVESLSFSIHRKKGRYLNCQLGYGAPDRFWSLDFHDRKCSGIGFDT